MNTQGPEPLPDFDAAWDYNQPDQTAETFTQILQRTRATAPPHYTAELLTQLARTHSLRREFDRAHELLDQVDAMLAQPGMQTARVRYLLERGRTFNSNGQKALACEQFEAAWQEGQRLHLDGYAVDAAHMLGIASDHPDTWHERAWELASRSSQPAAQRWRGSLANNIGWARVADEDYPTALTWFERAETFRRESGDEAEIQIARWCVAKCLRLLDRCDEAIPILRDLEQHPLPDAEPGYTYEELGECLHAQGNTEAARPYFAKAHEHLSQDPWLQRNEANRLARLKRLAQP